MSALDPKFAVINSKGSTKAGGLGTFLPLSWHLHTIQKQNTESCEPNKTTAGIKALYAAKARTLLSMLNTACLTSFL